MSGVREARRAEDGKVQPEDAERIILHLRQTIPSLRTENGVKQLKQCIDKLAKTKLINDTELSILRAATDGDPNRTEPLPEVRTQPAPDHGMDARYLARYAGTGKPGEEGYLAIRFKLVEQYKAACKDHDGTAAQRWRELVEGLDHRFQRAAQADSATAVDERLDLDSRENGHWLTVARLRAKAFARPDPHA